MLKDSSKILKPRSLVGWGPVSAVVVTLLIYFGSQILVGIALGIYIALTGVDESQAIKLLEDSVFVQFIFMLGVASVSVWLLWQFMKWRKISFKDLGLKKPSVDNLLLAPVVFVVYFIALVAVIAAVSTFIPSIDVDQEQQIGFEGATGPLALALVFCSLVIFPAFVEEIMVRGFLYGGLVKKFSKISAALIASFIFGIAHLQLGSGASPLWVAAIDTFILSMFLIWLREKTGNLWAGIAVHAIKNSLAFVTIFILQVNI